MGSHVDYWHHNRGPEVPDLWENETQIKLRRQYMTDTHHRAVDQVHRAERRGAAAVLPRRGLQRAALAVSAGPTSRRRRRAPARTSCRRTRTPPRAPTTRPCSSRRSGRRADPADARSSRACQQHHRDLHQRQRRRVAVEQRAAVQPQVDGVGGRHPRARADQVAGPDPCWHACRIRRGSRSTWSASIVAAAGATVPPTYEGINLFPILEGRQPQVERTLYWRSVRTTGRSAPCAAATGSWWSTPTTSWSSTCATDIGERPT